MSKRFMVTAVFIFWFMVCSSVYAVQSDTAEKAMLENARIIDRISRAMGETALRNENSLKTGDGAYDIRTETYINYSGANEIILRYPQLEKQKEIAYEKINELLENDVKRILRNSMYDENNYYLDMDYEIKFLNEDIISVLYKGKDGAASSSSHDFLRAMGTTIDLKNAKVLHLADIVKDFEGVAELMEGDRFVAVSVRNGRKSSAKLSEQLKDDDRENFLQDLQTYGSGYVETVEWYTTGKTVVIIYRNPRYEEYAGGRELLEYETYSWFWEKVEENAIKEADGAKQAEELEAKCQMLNQDIFGENARAWFTEEMKTQILTYADEVKGEYEAEVDVESMFPPELVESLEEMFYRFFAARLEGKRTWEERQDIYYGKLEEYGASGFIMDKEDVLEAPDGEVYFDADYYYERFHFCASGQDYYVGIVTQGARMKYATVCLLKMEDGELKSVGGFDTNYYATGRVIEYDGEFYFVFLESHDILATYDGFRIYKLEEDMERKNLQVKYRPYDYVWKTIYSEPHDIQLDYYVEGIKQNLISEEYLEMGRYFVTYDYMDTGNLRGVEVFKGDEWRLRYGKSSYGIDFMNMGLPITVGRGIWEDVLRGCSSWRLCAAFYVQNPETGEDIELNQMEITREDSIADGMNLVQLWFSEIEGKVYTFCLYHVPDYNFVLDVVLFEGTQATRLRTEVIVPKRHFALLEGMEHIDP